MDGERKQVAVLEAQIKAYLNAGDRDTAARIALELKRAKDDLAENEKQLALHEQAYQNNLLKIQHAVKKLDEVKHKIGKYDADLKMSRAEAEVAQLANQFHFDVTTDFGQAEQMIQGQIDRNRARVRVAADMSGEGLEEIQQDIAVEKAMAEDALREFEKEQGLATPETTKASASTKELGPGHPHARADARDLTAVGVGRRPTERRPSRTVSPSGHDATPRTGAEAMPTRPRRPGRPPSLPGEARRRPSPPGSRPGPASSPSCTTPARPASSSCTATSTT